MTHMQHHTTDSFRDVLRREWMVIRSGQSAQFRIVKYSILIPAFVLIYMWKGAEVTGTVLKIVLVISISIHLLYRWATHQWTRSWGGYVSRL